MNREATKKSIAFANWYNSYVVVLFLVRGGSRPLLAGRGYVSKDRGEANRDPSPYNFFGYGSLEIESLNRMLGVGYSYCPTLIL